MALLLRGMNINFEREFYFHSVRKWRFDFAIPEKKIAIEIEGGTFGKIVVCNHCHKKVFFVTKTGKIAYVRQAGGHNSGKGYKKDIEKYEEASFLGWTLLRFTTVQVERNPQKVCESILRAIENVNNSSM